MEVIAVPAEEEGECCKGGTVLTSQPTSAPNRLVATMTMASLGVVLYNASAMLEEAENGPPSLSGSASHKARQLTDRWPETLTAGLSMDPHSFLETRFLFRGSLDPSGGLCADSGPHAGGARPRPHLPVAIRERDPRYLQPARLRLERTLEANPSCSGVFLDLGQRRMQ